MLLLADSMRDTGAVSVPRRQLAAALNLSEKRVTERIRHARELGYLDTVLKGRPGQTASYIALIPVHGAPGRTTAKGAVSSTHDGAARRPTPIWRKPTADGAARTPANTRAKSAGSVPETVKSAKPKSAPTSRPHDQPLLDNVPALCVCHRAIVWPGVPQPPCPAHPVEAVNSEVGSTSAAAHGGPTCVSEGSDLQPSTVDMRAPSPPSVVLPPSSSLSDEQRFLLFEGRQGVGLSEALSNWVPSRDTTDWERDAAPHVPSLAQAARSLVEMGLAEVWVQRPGLSESSRIRSKDGASLVGKIKNWKPAAPGERTCVLMTTRRADEAGLAQVTFGLL